MVKSKKNPTHVAYLPSALQLHVDLSFYKYKPGVGIFSITLHNHLKN